MVELFISKASYKHGILSKASMYSTNSLQDSIECDRSELIYALHRGYQLTTITKEISGKWIRIGIVNIVSALGCEYLRVDKSEIPLDYLGNIPLVLPKRKLFISYYDKSDREYKILFEILYRDLIINKSVADGDINEGNSTSYIKSLIQKGYLNDTTIIVALVSKFTKCRKHIDWEISGALNYKVGNAYAGLIGLHLPHHEEFGVPTYITSLQPARLADNADTGYAKIHDWTYDRCIMQRLIEDAFDSRESRINLRKNDREQMVNNTGGD